MSTFKLSYRPLSKRIIALGAPLLIVGLLAGCSDVEKGTAEVKQAFPHNVSKKTFVLGLTVAEGGGTVTVSDRNRLAFFAREFLRRTRSAMTITTAKAGSDSASSAELVKRDLVSAGLRPESIIFKSTANPNDTANNKETELVLSFDGYAIKPPQCGNWQGNTGRNPSGLPHTDFGCSYQRNLGLMLSDPGDLVEPRIVGAPDAPSSDRVIGAHRTGKATTSAPPSGEKGTISSVAAE